MTVKLSIALFVATSVSWISLEFYNQYILVCYVGICDFGDLILISGKIITVFFIGMNSDNSYDFTFIDPKHGDHVEWNAVKCSDFQSTIRLKS